MLRPRDQRFLSVLKNPCVRWITPGRAAPLGLTALRARCGDDCGESPEPPQSLQLSSDADLLRCLRSDEHFDLPLLPLDVATERSAISTVPSVLLTHSYTGLVSSVCAGNSPLVASRKIHGIVGTAMDGWMAKWYNHR